MKNLLLIIASTLTFQLTMAQTPVKTDSASAEEKMYRSSVPRINDLIHTKLDARFDFDKSYLYGKIWLTLQPHFYPTDSLALDAKGMDIKQVSLISGQKTVSLKYDYDKSILNIHLNRTYKRGEKYTVYIDYTAKPNELSNPNAPKGLYFINPKGEDKNKPTQIWTQGETESNSVWCPIIDKPNQKTTDEIYMTIPQKFVTLSNGKLMSQKVNGDGTRTDYWKMDLPHAPYLLFMGAGDFAIVKDFYKGKEVNYYVEKEYASVAKKIFGYTPEMMALYARLTGVDYPWVKYSQIVCRDYGGGAMENTTATIHQESAQQDARELVDGIGWESTIAHELFHQWFGDLVTCESWSNLTLNESFANYSQTLWNEYKYGKDAGAAQNFTDMQGYLGSGSQDKDLVRYHYDDKDDMFDAVSYNKGGRILNMLRNYLGDSAFFKGLNIYLTTNKFKSAEAHQLRLAMEEVSGLDLNWFFNQWYFGSGHPILDISYTYDDNAKKVTVLIKQTQAGEKVFRLPIAIDIYNGSTKVRHNVWIEDKEQTFSFNYEARPDLVNVDADKILLCEKKDHKTVDNFIYQYKHAGNYVDRREAIDVCAENQNSEASLELIKLALKDKYVGLRNYTLSKLNLKDPIVKNAVEPILEDLSKNDIKSTVRAGAITLLGEYKNNDYRSLFVAAIKDSSYSVAGSALDALALIDSTAAISEMQKIKNQPAKGKLCAAILQLLAEYGTEEDYDIVANNFAKLPLGQAKFNVLQLFSQYLTKVNDTEKFKKGIDMIVAFRKSVPRRYRSKTVTLVNTVIFPGIITQKETQLSGSNATAAKEQIEYIKSKM